MSNRQRNRREISPLTIFAILSIGFILAVIVIFVVLVLAAKTGTVQVANKPIPYTLNLRTVPNVFSLNELLPAHLGKFNRTDQQGDLSNFKATYVNGTNKIDLVGSQAISVRLAQASVAQAEQAAGGSMIQSALDDDPSYALITTSSGVHLAWSHDRWFFSVTASSQTALDTFMTVFIY